MHTRLIAHRGGSGLRVENTLAAFAHAIELGVYGAELDVHLSRDGEVMVHHDDCLNPGYCRRRDGDWIGAEERLPLAEMTCAELQAFEIGAPRPGSDYARRFDRIQPVADQHIPRLQEVIQLVRERNPAFVLVVEIKTPQLAAEQKPWRALVDAVLQVLDQGRQRDHAKLCSFDWGALRYARQQCPDVPTWFTTVPLSHLGNGTPPAQDLPPDREHLARLRAAWADGDAAWYAGFDPRRFDGSYPRAVAAAGGAAWFPFHRDVNRANCREAEQHGLDTATWSVNLRDRDELVRLAATGVRNLVVDYPDIALPG